MRIRVGVVWLAGCGVDVGVWEVVVLGGAAPCVSGGIGEFIGLGLVTRGGGGGGGGGC